MGLKNFIFNLEKIGAILNIISSFMSLLKYVIIKNNYFYLNIKSEKLLIITLFINKFTLTNMKLLHDIVVVDYPGNLERFKLVYHFGSYIYNFRFFIFFFIQELAKITSINHIFKSVNWLEREVWDMFGIKFFNNFDLRRILTDYSFSGYPLRKDFPLTGYLELMYDELQNSIINRPVEVMQELRFFHLSNYWEL
jgi:NADH-quinone oxidoreductase subunit C